MVLRESNEGKVVISKGEGEEGRGGGEGGHQQGGRDEGTYAVPLPHPPL